MYRLSPENYFVFSKSSFILEMWNYFYPRIEPLCPSEDSVNFKILNPLPLFTVISIITTIEMFGLQIFQVDNQNEIFDKLTTWTFPATAFRTWLLSQPVFWHTFVKEF